jgi:putative DNA primase/helicase
LNSKLIKLAKEYGNEGFSVIPVRPKGKKSLIRWKGYQTRLPSDAELNSWWTKTPKANIGIVTGKISDLVVIDCDSDDACKRFLAAYPDAKHTRQVKTPRGIHFYFKHTPGIPNSAGRIGQGIDVRSDGGYVVTPPSIHQNGMTYEWLNRKSVQPLTQKLKELILRPNRNSMKSKINNSTRKTIDKGERNNRLTSMAGSLNAKGFSQESILAALRSENKLKCDPPLSDNEVQQIAESISRYPVSARADELVTEASNAGRFAARHSDEVRYCAKWKSWLVWDGIRWRRDEDGAAMRKAKETTKAIYAEASAAPDEETRKKLSRHAMTSERASAIKAMLYLAQSDEKIAIRPEALDTDPWLLNVTNGTINLKTGVLEQHNRNQNITKLAPVEYLPSARCPHWERFLGQIMVKDEEMIDFLQRAIGWSLTGDVSDQKLFFFHGSGANGKSTFLTIIREMLGDYAKQAAPELLVAKPNGSHNLEIADLQGSRFVVAVEMDAKARMAQALVKQITGEQVIKGRRLYQEFVEFPATHKIFLAANHKPIVPPEDLAMWRRILCVPFDVIIPEAQQDKDLLSKLRKELPGILTWAVEGCLQWQEIRLNPPPKVQAATESYRSEMDFVTTFISEQCNLGAKEKVGIKTLHESFLEWCDDNGEQQKLSFKDFSDRIKNKGFTKSDRQRRGYSWKGIGLKK